MTKRRSQPPAHPPAHPPGNKLVERNPSLLLYKRALSPAALAAQNDDRPRLLLCLESLVAAHTRKKP